MPLKILHWYPNFLHGGAVAYAILGLAIAQARLGARVVIAAAGSARRHLANFQPDLAGVELVKWHPAGEIVLARHLVRLSGPQEMRRLQDVAPDLVHVHGAFNLDNLRVPMLYRCPVVSSPHGSFHPAALAERRPALKRAYLVMERWLLRHHPRLFHVLSPAERDQLEALLPGSPSYCVPQGPSTLVPVSRDPAGSHDQGVRRPPGASLLFVGRLDVFTKGLDILLDAFAAAVRRTGGHDMRLVLAGPDVKGSRRWLERRVAQLGVQDKVEFTGALSGQQVGQKLAEADIYVQVSRSEGFPLSVVEAMLANKPAVLSTATGVVSYPEVAGLPHIQVVPVGSPDTATALLEAAKRLPELTEAAHACRDLVEDFFSWDRVARLHLEQYARLVA